MKEIITKDLITVILGSSFLIGLTVFLAVRNRKRMNIYYERLSTLSSHFPGSLSGKSKFLNDMPVFNGNFAANEFSMTYWRVEGGLPTQLLLKYNFQSSNKMKIFMYSKNPGVVLFAKRIYTRDSELDKYFIYSNKPEDAMRYLADQTRRESIKQIVASGWQPPMICGTNIRTSSFNVHQPLDPEMIKATLNNLIKLRI